MNHTPKRLQERIDTDRKMQRRGVLTEYGIGKMEGLEAALAMIDSDPLLSAAEDLLSACQAAEKMLCAAVRAGVSEDIMPDVGSHHGIKMLRDAIAKATKGKP